MKQIVCVSRPSLARFVRASFPSLLSPRSGLLGLSLLTLLVAAGGASAFAASALPVSDSFEGSSIYPYWQKSQAFGSVALSSDVAYSGSHALKFSSTSGGDRKLTLSHSFGVQTKGTVSIAFYDAAPGQETLYEQLTVSNSTNSAVAVSVGTMDFDSECYEASFGAAGPNAACGIYPQMTTSPVKRTTGWHVFSISFGQSHAEISIDGRLVYSASGNYQFDTVQLAVSGPSWRPDTVAYFDDFRFDPLTY